MMRATIKRNPSTARKKLMRRRPGRPRTNLEDTILAEMSEDEKKAEEIVAQAINSNTPSIMSFEAACLLFGIERGASPQAIRRTAIFQKINQYAKKNGPHDKWVGPHGVRDFLKEFISFHAPRWNYREEALQGAIEDRNYQQENERIAQEQAEVERYELSWETKYYTPDAPDGFLLCGLAWEYRKRQRLFRRTWPTLRELKLATAIPERTLKKIVLSLRPNKGEIVKEPLRHKFSRRGAVPLRYGPRLVVGVLNEFLNRLPEFPIDDVERKRLRRTALLVKRAFVAKLAHSAQGLNAC